MNPRFHESFPGQRKIEEEAYEINEAVDAYVERPLAKTSRSLNEVAHEIVKDKPHKEIRYENLSPSERQWMRSLNDAGVSLLTDGWVEVTRWDKRPGKQPELIKQKVDGINSAIRMQDHILGRYDTDDERETGEYKELESIEEVIERANHLLRTWKGASAEEKAELEREITEVVLQLENCRNEFKLNTKGQMEEVLKFKDSKDRVNPGALAARTVSALYNIGQRLDELQVIAPSIAFRKEILVLERRRSESNIRKARSQVNAVLHHAVFSRTSRKKPTELVRDDEVRFLDRDVNKALFLLDRIFCAPYKQQAEQARVALMAKVKENLTSKKALLLHIRDVREALNNVIEILRADMSDFG